MRFVRRLGRSKAIVIGASCALAVLSSPRRAFGRDTPALDEEPDAEELSDFEEEAFGTRGLVRTRAETVSFDGKAKSIELSGNVRVDSPPFHLRSKRLTLARTKYGIEADGKARLAFCPCLGTPVTIEFEKAIVAPPGELILKSPTLEVYGIPVMWLPWFWLRSDDKVGLLPPEVAYRGQDGVYAGGGIHLPWRARGAKRSFDVLGGGYVNGGFVTDVRFLTPSSSTKVRFDRLEGGRAPSVVPAGSADGSAADGLAIESRGASASDGVTVAWDADLLRGRRGVVATTDLDTAAKPWDRAAASASLRAGAIVAESGFRAVSRRGGDLGAVESFGPFAALRSSGALSPGITYDATLEGGSLRLSGPAESVPDSNALTYGRAELGAHAATRFGPIDASLRARGAGDLAAEGRRDGGDRAGTVRARFGLPLARAYGDARDVVHVIDPFMSVAVLHTAGNAILGSLPGRGLASVRGTAPIAEAGVTTSVGTWATRRTLEVTASSGGAYASDAALPLLRGRLASSLGWLGAAFDTAHVFGRTGRGSTAVGRVRVGYEDSARAYAHVAMRDGVDPVVARALTDASLEAPAGFLAREGTTGGTGLVVPWIPAFTTSAGVDIDAAHRDLVAARAGIELRDRCRCVTLRANSAHRIGRRGVDVWVSLDFATNR